MIQGKPNARPNWPAIGPRCEPARGCTLGASKNKSSKPAHSPTESLSTLALLAIEPLVSAEKGQVTHHLNHCSLSLYPESILVSGKTGRKRNTTAQNCEEGLSRRLEQRQKWEFWKSKRNLGRCPDQASSGRYPASHDSGMGLKRWVEPKNPPPPFMGFLIPWLEETEMRHSAT